MSVVEIFQPGSMPRAYAAALPAVIRMTPHEIAVGVRTMAALSMAHATLSSPTSLWNNRGDNTGGPGGGDTFFVEADFSVNESSSRIGVGAQNARSSWAPSQAENGFEATALFLMEALVSFPRERNAMLPSWKHALLNGFHQ